jgi:hypothetical protein
MATLTAADSASRKTDEKPMKKKSPLYDRKKSDAADEGSSGNAGVGFNTPGRSGAKGGKTPSREEQPKTTMEALADAPAKLLGVGDMPNPKTSPGTTGKGGTPIDSGNGSTGPGGDAMSAMMKERGAMSDSQEDERRDLHGTHRTEYRKMQERHDAEVGAASDREGLARAHRKHELERMEMQQRHMQAQQDAARRHNGERMQMHSRHEDLMGASSAAAVPVTDDEKYE